VTNDHVVEGGGDDARIMVRFGREGRPIDADLLGKDPSTDLAVLSIAKRSIPKGVKPLQFADSRAVRVGDLVVAIGNPFGLDQTATQGIVSALGRDIEAPNNYTINNVIQTDAPINPGNSGGPLLDDSAHVVGVNSQIATSGGQGNVGIGFAVPSNTVRQIVPILKRGGTVRRAYLGVQTSTPETGETGAQIASVVPGGPAATGRLRVGDVIKSVDGRRVTDPAQLSTLVSGSQPGQRVAVVVERAGQKQTLQVTLGVRPQTTSNP
jgi:putative serine protease PepD